MRRLYLTLVLIFCFAINAYSQQDSLKEKYHKVIMISGNDYVGVIVSENDTLIVFRDMDGITIEIPRAKIKSITKIKDSQVHNGVIWNDDPNQTRLLFAPTGRGLKAGKGYFSVYEVFFPFVSVGVTDWFTIAGGMTLFPGADDQLKYFAPKFTPYSNEEFSASLGLLYISVFDEGSGGIAYGVASYGNEKISGTIGLGYGFSDAEFAKDPILVLGGELRISRYTKFITENWIIPGVDYNLMSLAIRFFGDNLAADFGFFTPIGIESNSQPLMPWLGFAYNF